MTTPRSHVRSEDPARGMVRVIREKRCRRPLWVVTVDGDVSTYWIAEFPLKEKHSALNVADWLRICIRYAVTRALRSKRAGRKGA